MTSTFELYATLIGNSRRFHSNWSDVPTTYGKTRLAHFQEPNDLSEVITAKRENPLNQPKPFVKVRVSMTYGFRRVNITSTDDIKLS